MIQSSTNEEDWKDLLRMMKDYGGATKEYVYLQEMVFEVEFWRKLKRVTSWCTLE